MLAGGHMGQAMAHNLVTYYGDADGVNNIVLSASASNHAHDLGRLLSWSWSDIARLVIGLHVNRVESKANLADGPTRYNLTKMDRLQAVWREPILPSWVFDIWSRTLFQCRVR